MKKQMIVMTWGCAVLAVLMFMGGCSSNNPELLNTEQVRPAAEYSLFNILDQYPALNDAINNIDSWSFSAQLKELTNSNPEDSKRLFKAMKPLVTDGTGTPGPLLVALGRVASLMGVINEQNDYDTESVNYTDDFYSFLDHFFQSNAKLSQSLFPIVRKSTGYVKDTYNNTVIDSVMDDLMNFLRDTSGDQNVRSVLIDFQEGAGKLLVRANSYESGSNKVGNGVDGVDKLLSSINTFSENAAGRDKFYNVIREMGNLTAVSITANGTTKYLKDIIKDFVIKNASLFIGGTTYAPGADYKNANPYVNAQLDNSIKEIFPALTQLFLRSDHPNAIIADDVKKNYPLEHLSQALYGMGLDVPNMNLEQSLYDLVRYDGYGRDRVTNSQANGLTFLEGMIYNVLAANYTGYLTRMSTSGEPNDNHDRGHGASTGGAFTLNDCLYSMGNGEHKDLLGEWHNAYSLCLNNRTGEADANRSQGDFIYRSSSPFPSADRGLHRFFIGYDFPALCLLSGAGAGDAGIPNGGEPAIIPDQNATTVGTNNDYRTYFPKVSNGIGDMNTARWVMGWIARACWEGEGPYYSTQGAVSAEGGLKVFSPSGKVYAIVNKSNSQSWSFTYVNPEHYRASWNTDYFLIKARKHYGTSLDENNRYFAPNRVIGTSSGDRFKMGQYKSNTYAPSTSGGALTYVEKITEGDQSRECATHEEAMVKNYQWLMGEKKFVFVIPMFINVEKCSIDIKAAAYCIAECNGIAGITNARKGPGNNVWNIKGSEGLDIVRNHGASDRTGNTGLNYGDSYEFADSRLTVVMKEDYDSLLGIGDGVHIGHVWDEILQGGKMLPNVVGVNLAPVVRMAFHKNESMVLSSQAGVSGGNWANRNRLFPVLVGLFGKLHEKTLYIPSGSGNNYNYGAAHRYPMKTLIDGVMAPLSKPLFRRYTDNGGRWVPRILANSEGETSSKFLERSRNDDFYRARGELYTTLGILAESEKKKVDGIVVALSKTKLVTRIVDLLAYNGNPAFDDPANFDPSDSATWGARRKLFYALEQVVTSIRTSQGEAVQLGYYGLSYPSWVFTQNERHIDLDNLLDSVLGSYEASGRGLAGVIFRHNQANNWTNYGRVMDALPELLSSNGTTAGKYNITEDLIGLLDNFLKNFKATDNELKAVRHTLGTIMYRYNSQTGQWAYGPELVNLLTTDLPAINDAFRSSGGSAAHLLSFMQAVLKENGFGQYMADRLHTRYSSRDVVTQLHAFLDSRLMSQPNPFWLDLANLLDYASGNLGGSDLNTYNLFYNYPGMMAYSGMINPGEPTNPYQGLAGYDADRNEFDPYLVLGELLSDRQFTIETVK